MWLKKRGGKNNGRRSSTKSSGHIPEPRQKEQDTSDDLSRQWREAAGDCHMVRQLLCPLAPRRSFAARLQACDIDHYARCARPPHGGGARRGPARIAV